MESLSICLIRRVSLGESETMAHFRESKVSLMFKFLRKLNPLKRKFSYAKELYQLGKMQPMKFPHLSLKDADTFSTTITLQLPKFTKHLAKLKNLDIESYIDQFLVTSLYMEQNLRVDQQPLVLEKTHKTTFVTHKDIKNPLMN